MARTQLVAQTVDSDGLVNATFSAANVDGHWILPGEEIEVVNASGGSINVTIQTGGSLAGYALADQVTAVPNNQRAKFGNFDSRAFVRPSGVSDPGVIYVDFSAVSSVTCAAFKRG